MKKCSAAEMAWPTNLVFQMKENTFVSVKMKILMEILKFPQIVRVVMTHISVTMPVKIIPNMIFFLLIKSHLKLL